MVMASCWCAACSCDILVADIKLWQEPPVLLLLLLMMMMQDAGSNADIQQACQTVLLAQCILFFRSLMLGTWRGAQLRMPC